MRLAVNEWPDGIRNDSSKGKVQIGKWVFFAVTYDATKQRDNVCWYFGDEDVPKAFRKSSTEVYDSRRCHQSMGRQGDEKWKSETPSGTDNSQ